jgi:hypothetical protein
MHESIDESPFFMIICFLRGENAQLWRNFNGMSRFLETFNPIIELWRLKSVRRQQVNTLYSNKKSHITIFC